MNPYKDVKGAWLTTGLFLETSNLDANGYAIYTIGETEREYNGKMYKCFRELYLSCDDPTEYEVATKYLGGWKHWQRILRSTPLRRAIDDWRMELEAKLRSRGVQGMLAAAATGGTRGANAAKWLADRGWEQRAAGAPSKAEKARALKVEQHMEKAVESDLQRIRTVQ
jgi:hypothetical protein